MSYQAITAQLKTTTALHVGSGRGNEVSDALLRRNGQGQIVIPGTAIAGVLRTLATRLAPRLGHPPCQALHQPGQEADAQPQPENESTLPDDPATTTARPAKASPQSDEEAASQADPPIL